MMKVINHIHESVVIGHNTNIWHGAYVGQDTKIGNDSMIGSLAHIDDSCNIGDNCRIQGLVYLPRYTIIEDDVFIGPMVCVTNDKYPMQDTLEGVTIKKGARIGASSVLLAGITIGKGAKIGMGSVVTKDVPDGETWFGSPAERRGSKW